MFAVLHALGMFLADLFKSCSRLEVEILFLRHQLDIALRQTAHRLWQRSSDRAFIGRACLTTADLNVAAPGSDI